MAYALEASVVVEGFIRPWSSDSASSSSALPVTEKARAWAVYFSAIEVLAKPDDKYMPEEVAAAIENNRGPIGLLKSNVSAVLEIPKSRFMILVREGAMVIYKVDIHTVHYFNTYREMLDQKELDILDQFIKKNNIDIVQENAKIKETKGPDAPSWEDAANIPPIDPPLGADDQAEGSDNIIGAWGS